MQSDSLKEDALQTIMIEAGRDLAHINTIAVAGFGRLRGQVETEQLEAPYPTCRAVVLTGWDDSIRYLASTVLSASEVSMLEHVGSTGSYPTVLRQF